MSSNNTTKKKCRRRVQILKTNELNRQCNHLCLIMLNLFSVITFITILYTWFKAEPMHIYLDMHVFIWCIAWPIIIYIEFQFIYYHSIKSSSIFILFTRWLWCANRARTFQQTIYWMTQNFIIYVEIKCVNNVKRLIVSKIFHSFVVDKPMTKRTLNNVNTEQDKMSFIIFCM